MAILQALFSLLARSAGKVLNAAFGWAVLALFGQTSPKEQTVLSGVVAAAAAWPILLLGVIVPKVALLVVAFVPLAKSVPNLWLRLIWTALALAVPIAVGTAVAARGNEDQLPEPRFKRLLRGFPITIALAAAFLMMMVIAPAMKLATIARRKVLVHVPGVMQRGLTPVVMAELLESLAAHGMRLERARAPWHLRAPSKVLLKLGGRAFGHMAKENVDYARGDTLEVSVMPNETVLRGDEAEVGRARALLLEVFGPREVAETFNPRAQELERQLKRVWSVYAEQPVRHRDAPALRQRLDAVSAELATRNLPWDEWQIVYRLSLQLDRALRGERPLLEHAGKSEERNGMENSKERLALPGPRNETRLANSPGTDVAVPVSVEAMSNRQLVGHIVESATLLAKKEIELARTELKADIKREVAMAKGLGVAGLCALFAVNLMLVACAFALALVVPGWAAALIVAAVVLAVGTVAGLVGWGKRVKEPLESTRRSLKEDAQWAKERLA